MYGLKEKTYKGTTLGSVDMKKLKWIYMNINDMFTLKDVCAIIAKRYFGNGVCSERTGKSYITAMRKIRYIENVSKKRCVIAVYKKIRYSSAI